MVVCIGISWCLAANCIWWKRYSYEAHICLLLNRYYNLWNSIKPSNWLALETGYFRGWLNFETVCPLPLLYNGKSHQFQQFPSSYQYKALQTSKPNFNFLFDFHHFVEELINFCNIHTFFWIPNSRLSPHLSHQSLILVASCSYVCISEGSFISLIIWFQLLNASIVVHHG